MSTEEIYQNIIEEAESLEQELIKLRREFHQYPEQDGWRCGHLPVSRNCWKAMDVIRC